MSEVLRRTDSLLELLVLQKTETMRDLVSTALLVRNYEGFVAAAQAAIDRGAPNVWTATLMGYHANVARLSVLYTLTHWGEIGARTVLDVRLTRRARG